MIGTLDTEVLYQELAKENTNVTPDGALSITLPHPAVTFRYPSLKLEDHAVILELQPPRSPMNILEEARAAAQPPYNLRQLPWHDYVAEHVKPLRVGLRRANHEKYWWIHHEPRPGMRKALNSLKRYLGTSMVSKHRFFVWLDNEVVPSNKVVVIARDDNFTFGVLNSHTHSLWSSVKGGKHGVGNDLVYQNGTCFETFPFPRPTEAQHAEIEKWANYLDTVRSQLLEADEKRTMTKLYNDLTVLRETRDSSSPVYALLIAHDKLDAAVAAAYGWEWPLSDETILERLLALNLERSAEENAQPVKVGAG